MEIVNHDSLIGSFPHTSAGKVNKWRFSKLHRSQGSGLSQKSFGVLFEEGSAGAFLTMQRPEATQLQDDMTVEKKNTTNTKQMIDMLSRLSDSNGATLPRTRWY